MVSRTIYYYVPIQVDFSSQGAGTCKSAAAASSCYLVGNFFFTKNSFSSITSFPFALEQKGAQSGTTTKALYHVRPRQSTVFGKSVLRNSTNSSSKCPFHQVTKRNPQMWLMAQMKACDMPMKKCISLCLPGQVDGHIVVLQHDEAGL